MIFVDTNIVMYAVGRAHPLREEARDFFRSALDEGTVLVTSAEVLQELLHAYLPVGRLETLDAALALIRARVGEVCPWRPTTRDWPGCSRTSTRHSARVT